MKGKSVHYIFIFSLFLGILAPTLFSDGMFMDGTIYASISLNLANNVGSFWNLHFTNTLFPVFNEHPPLAIYLSSLSFKLFGDSIISERIYSLLTVILAILLIIFVKKEFIKDKSYKYIIIAPLIFIMLPSIPWTYSNNMLENTMTVFVLFSALFILKSFKTNKVIMLFLSGFFLFLAFLSKGFPSLFVWSIVFFYWLIYKKISFSRVITDTFLIVFFTLLPLIVIYIFSETANDGLIRYFNTQVVASIKNIKTVDSRFYIIGSFFKEILVPISIIVILAIVAKIKKIKINYNNDSLKDVFFFFLIALSGVVPIMVSMKQRSFYIIAALPFIAISLSFFIENILEEFPEIIKFFKRRFFVPLSYVLLVISISMIFVFYGKPGRDKETLHDVYIIANEVPKNETISICKDMYSYWSLHAYLQRYGMISITDKPNNKYYLSVNNCFKDTAYHKLTLNLKKYTLYKRKGFGKQ